MDFTPSPTAEQFGDEVRALVARTYTDERRQHAHDTGTMHDWELHRAMADQGWIRQALPEALGGGGRGPEELAVLFRELELAGAPYDGMSICTMVASVLAHAGNEMQQREILPKLLSGESLIALGYSEPDAGSDVAAARTRAVRDGDGWRIDGQKIFTSLAEESEWVFLLTRTNVDVPKHRGLTFFLVPTSAPGFELQPIRTLSGKRTNMTFYDGVQVGDEWRVGDVDGGWQVMLVALSFERGVAGGVRDAERLLAMAEAHAATQSTTTGVRSSSTWPGGTRWRVWRSTPRSPTCSRAAPRGWPRRASFRASRARRASCSPPRRSNDRSAAWSTSPAPPDSCSRTTCPTSSAFYEYCYRFAPVTTIYGGTSEIQRNLVAQRGLGLPRGN